MKKLFLYATLVVCVIGGNNPCSGADAKPKGSSVKAGKYDAFLQKQFDSWYEPEDAAKAHLTARLLDPKQIDWEKYSQDKVPAKFGEYTLNPEMQTFTDKDFENFARSGKIKLVKGSNNNIYNVARDIIANSSANHYIPGIELWKWMIENPDKLPKEFKDKDYKYVFLGSAFRRGTAGEWAVPYMSEDKGKLSAYMKRVILVWDGTYIAVVIEK